MSDITIEFRVKNGRLKRAIFAAGWPSYIAFCRANHISYPSLNALLCMREPALGRNDWRPVAMDIATALHKEPEELWPSEMARAELRINKGEFAVSLEDAASLSVANINRRALAQLTKNLRPNELKAITALARGETLDDAGKGAGVDGGDVTRERARQLTLKAVRKMRRTAYLDDITFADVIGVAA